MIDFNRTGEGHIFRDFVELETVIKFQLFDETNLSFLYEFEKNLLSPVKFSESLDRSKFELSQDAIKAFDPIECIRKHAGRVIQPSDEMQDFYVGLFYQTVNLIRYYNLLHLKQRKNYILLSAALLCEKLANWQEW
jgi:hypothetical protein